MAMIRSSNTKLEQQFFALLDNAGIKFRPHPAIRGKPDCLIKPDILVFVDSDFWHGWHYKQWRGRMPKVYWADKIERNIRRDKQKFRTLRGEGYKVIRVWEHSLKRNPDTVVSKIRGAIADSTARS